MKQGLLFNIQRFSLHDGPGIRTTAFFMGCPLRCQWCHNPEGLIGKISLQYFRGKCITCGKCQSVCKFHVHHFSSGGHGIHFSACTLCGACIEVCPANALQRSGYELSAADLAQQLLADHAFYRDGGGVTFSGGEALLQVDFLAETAAILKQSEQWEKAPFTIAVDTCGYVPWETYEKALQFCDLFLYDVKAITPALHKEGTGCDNTLILENLFRLDKAGTNIWIRVPVIPGFNDTVKEMKKIAHCVCGLSSVTKVTLMPYHSIGKEKYASLGLEYPFAQPDAVVADEKLAMFEEMFRERGLVVEK